MQMKSYIDPHKKTQQQQQFSFICTATKGYNIAKA